MSQAVTFEDTRRHRSNDDPRWQESFYLGWVDLENRACGATHISLAPATGRDTHVWSWVMVDGKVVARSQQHRLPLPDNDSNDLKLGCAHLRQGNQPGWLALSVDYGQGISLDLELMPNCPPVELSLDRGDTVLGDRHYEIMGMVSGNIHLPDRVLQIQASCWSDHSWGPRDFSTNIAHRWLWASFGSDFSICAFGFMTTSGYFPFGWVWDAGAVHLIIGAEFHAVVADDGITPEGCDAAIRVGSNRMYRVHGRVLDAALMGGVGWHAMNGLTRYECNGRVGEGLLEINELKILTPAMKAELGI
jgi:hypothetical protein